MTKPILVAVDDEIHDREMIQRELLKRYADDYDVLCDETAEASLERLGRFLAPACAVPGRGQSSRRHATGAPAALFGRRADAPSAESHGAPLGCGHAQPCRVPQRVELIQSRPWMPVVFPSCPGDIPGL